MRRILTGLFLLTAWTAAPAADVAHGKALHEQNCVACHASLMGGEPARIYTRSDRRVGSFAALGTQVRMCEQRLGLRWFDEDVADVVEYLNQTYYHF